MYALANPIQDYSSLSKELKTQVATSILGRAVVWFKKPREDSRSKLSVKILAIAASCFLALTVVGIIPLRKALNYSKKMNNYRLMASKGNPEAPEIGLIEFKTKQHTFNHERDFVIHEGSLWTRERNQVEKPWELMYFEGGQNSEPTEIQADGANLMVLDSHGTLHYKKVLKERRKKGIYSATDYAMRDNWTKAWFSLPVVEKIVNLFNGNRKLQVPGDAVGWAMSHRGIYTEYFEDRGGKKHREFPMVTSAYLVPHGGVELLFTDPYVSSRFTKRIPLPDRFVIQKFAVSGSTLFLYGTLDGERRIYTRLADFDTLGKNFFLAGFWRKIRRGKEEWDEQPFVVHEGEVLSLSIEQTGAGNNARRLHIQIGNENETELHLSKMLTDEQWSTNDET